MKVYGMLEKAQLENIASSSTTPAPTGRIFADITSAIAALPKFFDGTSWKTIRLGNASTGSLNTNRVLTVGPNDAMTAADCVLVVNKGVAGASTITLPASPETGRYAVVKDGKGDANTFNITVQPAAGTIDGAATKVINTSYGVLRFHYNGTQWNLV